MNAESQPGLEHTLAETYDSSTDRIYLEAWEKTKGMKARFWQAVVTIVLIYFISTYLALIPNSLITTDTQSVLYNLLSELLKLGIRVFILTPLFAGLLMISIKHCSNIPAPINNIFHYFPYWKRLWVFPVILSGFGYAETIFEDQVVIQVALYLLSFIWVVLYLMYIPLAIEQNLPLATILEISRKTIIRNWTRVIGFLMVAVVILFASTLTLGIALIWTIPWFVNAFAVFYRELFGVQISLV